jgi:phosphoribosyl 1,2-cyclic phosphate phosphodiesterase
MKVKFIILGCGSSLGVPRADGNWGNCNPKIKRNYRTRCSAFIKSKIKNILIDTSPDLRHQLIKNNITNVNCVIYSHKHSDQVHGINDLRVFSYKNNEKMPVYADYETGKYIKNNFSYCFNNTPSYRAILKLNKLKKNFSFSKNGKSISIKSVPVKHGRIKCQSFIINKSCAYVSDANKIYNNDLKHFKNLNYFVIDCLRLNHHPSHFNLSEVIELTEYLKPKKAILTNLHADLDYNYLVKILPKNIVPAYDGMSFYI